MQHHITPRALAAFLIACVLSFMATEASAFSLTTIHTSIEGYYPSVQHLKSEDLNSSLEDSGSKIIIFDVRALDEFKVSRLKNAIHVEPFISTDEFQKKFAKAIKGKTVIFYCSVGLRSSQLVTRVQQHLISDGASSVYNLQGGIFNWHNEQRPLQDAKGQTDHVHPFDSKWGKLIERSNLTSYSRKKSQSN